MARSSFGGMFGGKIVPHSKWKGKKSTGGMDARWKANAAARIAANLLAKIREAKKYARGGEEWEFLDDQEKVVKAMIENFTEMSRSE